MAARIEIAEHGELSPEELTGLRDLFDGEYRASHGDWAADRPYGYSPADVHVIATESGHVVGHVGFQPRSIGVGAQDVMVAGVGGVLVHPGNRTAGLGRELMRAARARMIEDPGLLFGYLGCREEVVPFYIRASWSRIDVVEHCTSRADQTTVETSAGAPILVLPVHARLEDWPPGDIDLRGTPW